MNSLKNKKTMFFCALLIMLSISAMFLNSFHWTYEEISKRKILVWIIAFIGGLVLPVLVLKVRKMYNIVSICFECLVNGIYRIKENKKQTLLFCVSGILGVTVLHIVTYILSKMFLHKEYNVKLFYALLVVFFLFLFLIFMWKDAATKVEKIFLVIALSLGVFCIGVTADRIGIAWDDQIHYARTLEISNFLNGIMYDADSESINYTPYYGATGYDRESDYAYLESIEAIYETKASQTHTFENFGVWSMAYIPSALGIILGRGLNLSYVGVFNMGRFFNLLMYTTLIYLAIKKMQYGKVLIATIGLTPTTIFMAANYSYDPWVTGFVLLGYAYFFSSLQEESVKNSNLVIMIGTIVLGCLPKAIYFPLLFPLLFMPKTKFKNDRQRIYYYLGIIAMVLFLIATFLSPVLMNSAGISDVRGGTDVNAVEQIRFIVENPLAYMKILFGFTADYISVSNAKSMLQAYAYSGNGRYWGLVSLLLIVLAFLDRGQEEKEYRFVKITGLLSCAMAILLSVTALYISFTAVGASSVAGVQARYIIPTIFPALYCLGVGGTKHKINNNTFVCLPMLMVALTMIYNLTMFWVIPY